MKPSAGAYLRARRSIGHFSTFVSKHNKIGVDEVRRFLRDLPGMEMRENQQHFVVKDCSVLPDGICLKPSGTDKADNQWKVYIKSGKDPTEGGGGTWFCHRCSSKGSWYDLKNLANGTTEIHRGLLAASSEGSKKKALSSRPALKLPDQKLVARFPVTLGVNPGEVEEVKAIREYLTGSEPGQRGLKIEVLLKYGVGCAIFRFPEGNQYVNATCVTFPWVMSREELASQDAELRTTTEVGDDAGPWVTRRIKARAWQRKEWQRLDPPGGGWGLFGLHTVPAGAREVVLTEGEYDAMAVFQATGIPAVSLPNGAGSLPIDVLPLLERFERIYLWMDNDAPGQAGAEKFAKKIGVGRCFIVRPLKADLELFPTVAEARRRTSSQARKKKSSSQGWQRGCLSDCGARVLSQPCALAVAAARSPGRAEGRERRAALRRGLEGDDRACGPALAPADRHIQAPSRAGAARDPPPG